MSDDSSTLDNSDSEYLSMDENELNDLKFKKELFNSAFKHERSKPINIINDRVTKSDEYEILDISQIKPQSLPVNNTKTVTQSLKEYLYSSINLIKQSYNYVSSNKSI